MSRRDDSLVCADVGNLVDIQLSATVKQFFHQHFSDDVVNLTTAEIERLCERHRFAFGKSRHLAAPDQRLGTLGRTAEFHFEQETSFKGSIEIVYQICCRNQYAVKLFKFFKDDVLDGVLGLRDVASANILSLRVSCRVF